MSAFVSGVQHSNGTNNNTVWFNRKCEIQDGGHEIGNNDVSACRQVSNEIPLATPMFQGSSFHIGLTTTLLDLTGSAKSKVAATEPEVTIAQLVDKQASKQAYSIKIKMKKLQNEVIRNEVKDE